MKALIAVFAFFVSVGAYAQLSGTYTIGGTSPNYPTIDSAASDVASKGVNGAVTFHIRSGSYNEAVIIDSIGGASSSNTIIFKKDPGSTGDVYWYKAGKPLTFKNTSYVTVSDLILETTSSSNVIYFLGHNDHITIKKNTIRGISTSGYGYLEALIYNRGWATNPLNNVLIDSNKFSRGSYMVYLSGKDTSRLEKYNVITNNDYDSAGFYGIYAWYQDSLIIKRNTIKDNGTQALGTGLRVGFTPDFQIENNRVIQSKVKNGYGIEVIGGGGSSSLPSRIINNYVFLNGGVFGIRLTATSYTKVFHNTVRIEGVNVNSYGLLVYQAEAYVKNNNVSNHAGGYAVSSDSISLKQSDKNNFYASSKTKFGVWFSDRKSNFADWKKLSLTDSNSYNVNPFFLSASGPNPNNGFLNNSGETALGVSNDINGNSRSSTPDMGCVEFDIKAIDGGLTEIVASSICASTSNVKVRLTNFGKNTITQARIKWTVKTNSGSPVSQTAFSFLGSLSSLKDTLVSIGTFTFSSSNTYQVMAYIDQVNNIADSVKVNDTIVNIGKPAMTGTYTVGGVSPNFTSIQAASTALQQRGVCGQVTINIRQGKYNERVIVKEIPGTDSTNHVIFQTDPSSSKMAEIYYRGTVLAFYGASYVEFKNLKMESSLASNIVSFTEQNKNVSLIGDSIIGKPSVFKSSTYAVVRNGDYGPKDEFSNLRVSNCVILEGSYGIFSGSGSTASMKGVPNVILENNKILNSFHAGIYVFNGSTSIIRGNEIQIGSTSGHGVFISRSDSSSILENKILNKAGYGIYAEYCFGSASTPGVLIANNFISFSDTSGILSYGVYRDTTTYSKTLFNSVNILKGTINSSCSWSRGGQNSDVRNNIFSNQGSGYSQYYYQLGDMSISDYNNLYTGGTSIGYYLSSISSLNAWKTATNKDSNSVNVDPKYISNSNLHLFNSKLNGKGIRTSIIPKDIDGELRDTLAPDIGADEFTIYNRDVGITSVETDFCSGLLPVKARLQNFGNDSLVSTSIGWAVSVNGGTPIPQSNKSLTGLLNSGEDTVFTVGSYLFKAGSKYQILVYSNGVNGSTDEQNSNDTGKSKLTTYPFSGLYSIGPSTSDHWSTIDSAFLDLEKIGVCGPTTIYVKSGNYNESVAIDKIPGTSQSNTVLLLGDTVNRPHMYYNSSNSVIRINGVEYLSIKNFKISTTANWSAVIIFDKENQHVLIENNEIIAKRYSSINNVNSAIYNGGYFDDQQKYITIKNNVIRYGYNGVYWSGYNSLSLEKHNKFIGNKFPDIEHYGLVLIRQDSILVDSNWFESNRGWTTGLDLLAVKGFKVLNNSFNMIKGGGGIVMRSCHGSNTARNLVSNNFIAGVGTAVSVNVSNYLDFYHNSVHIYGATSTSSSCYYMHNSIFNRVKNNNLVNSAQGRAIYININGLGHYEGVTNNLYTNGAILGRMVKWSSSNAVNLAGWKQASSSDTNSISVNPNYKSGFDLHTLNPALNNVGTPLQIVRDIDNERRSLTSPDIGADEFKPLIRDGFLYNTQNLDSFCIGKNLIKWGCVNFGLDTIKQLECSISIDSAGVLKKSWLDTFQLAMPYLDSLTFTDSSFNFNYSGTYSITIRIAGINYNTDQYAFNDTTKYNVTIHPTPKYTIGVLPKFCSGQDSVQLKFIQSTSSIDYFGPFVSNGHFFPKNAGYGTHVISFKASTINNCSLIDTIVLNVDSVPNLSVDTIGPVCFNLNYLKLTSGKPAGGTYLGMNISNDTFNVKQSGSGSYNYYYKFVTAKGCADSIISKIIVADSIQHFTFKDTSLCNLDTIVVSTPQNQNYRYLWSTGDTNNSIKVFTSGVRSLQIWDSLNCSLQDTISIQTFSLPVFNISGDSNLCPSDTGSIYSSAKFNSYLWNNGSSSSNVKVWSQGVYWLKVTDTNQCSSSDSISVSMYQKLVISTLKDTAICDNDSIQVLGPMSLKLFKWNTGHKQRAYTINTAGQYSYEAIDTNGCIYRDSMNLTLYVTSNNLGNDTSICIGDTIILKASPIGKNYLWSTTDTSQSIKCFSAGVYWLNIIDSNSCSVLDSIKVNTNLALVPHLGVDTSFCVGDTHMVKVQGNFISYLWNTSDTSNSLSVTKTGNYWVRAIDSNRCVGRDTLFVRSDSLPYFNFGADTSICSFDSLILYPNKPGATYKWINGDTSAFILVDSSRIYGLTVIDSNGCYFSDSIKIRIDSLPVVDLGSDTSFCGSNTLILRSNINVPYYLWSTGDTIDSLALGSGGTYWLQVTDTNSCIGSDTIVVSYKAICVGIDENLLSNVSIQYYPNPNSGRFTLNLNANFTGKVELVIRNAQGQVVAAKTWEKMENDLIQEIDLEHQSTGIYFLELLTPLGKAQHRITLNR